MNAVKYNDVNMQYYYIGVIARLLLIYPEINFNQTDDPSINWYNSTNPNVSSTFQNV